ncbi:MAG: site-2 protease family protein [Thermoplasmatota archaeon]
MSITDILLLIAIILAGYIIGVIFLYKKGLFEKYNISFYGPALLLRTNKGVNSLRKIANKKRFWKGYGTVGVIFCFLMMIFMIFLLALNTWTVLEFTPEQQQELPGIEFGLVIPGLNPILPIEFLVYILIGLIIAVIVHEFSHGILTFAHSLKVKSLGVLYLIIPLGAFCEPDEDQLRETKISNRMRVYAAGPMSNFTVAIIVMIIFSFGFMAAVQPIDGYHIPYVVDQSPADDIGLQAGDVLQKLNNTEVENVSTFLIIMNNTAVNQTIPINYLHKNKNITTTVTLADKSQFSKNVSDKNDSFLGIGLNIYNVSKFIGYLQHPFTTDFPDGLILVYALPFFGYIAGYNPLVAPFTQGYMIQGPLSFLPSNLFWGITNTLYWIFWLNLVVGMFNVLPMIPLDGGFLFSDAIRGIVKRMKATISEEKRENIVRNVTIFISLIILFIVLFPWFVKYF